MKPHTIVVLVSSVWLPLEVRAESAAKFLGRGFANCDRFVEAIEAAQLDDAPDLFTCNRYEFKDLYLYGYFRFLSRKHFAMTLVTNKHGQCDGTGDLGWDGRNLSASGRFECKDGSQGGLAFEMEERREKGEKIRIGSIFGGIDGHKSRFNEEDRISEDFWVYDQSAVKVFMKERQ